MRHARLGHGRVRQNSNLRLVVALVQGLDRGLNISSGMILTYLGYVENFRGASGALKHILG